MLSTCLPSVFCDSGDTPANLLCELNGHLMPCTSCLYGKWVEDVCAGQIFWSIIVIINITMQRLTRHVSVGHKDDESRACCIDYCYPSAVPQHILLHGKTVVNKLLRK